MSGPSCASVHHVKIPVTDLEASVRWYQTVLKAKRETTFDRGLRGLAATATDYRIEIR
jgi:catechol 2,3-dioxygenase-like lactoylglutathione lyase family enzyme